jgi:threonine/homoserine/homoserine lactone efflux protein
MYMGPEVVVPWFFMVFPLTFSPGPANMVSASAGTRFGFVRTVPFVLGVNVFFAIQSLVIGAGVGGVLLGQPTLLAAGKYAAVLYMFYLAYKLFHSSQIDSEREVKPPSFWDGMVLQVLNFKALMVPVLMFTQFLNPNRPGWPQVLLMTGALIGLNLACGSAWIGGGGVVRRLFISERFVRAQGYVFGGVLALVAVWMALK